MRTPIDSSQNGISTLVVDSNGTAASRLAGQLNHSGFKADVATSCRAARVAIRAERYGALVVVADLNLASDLECLTMLRVSAPRLWLIVVSSGPHPDAPSIALQCGADALLTAPLSLADLIFRLRAFSHRSRPP